VTSHQSMRQAARWSALDAQAYTAPDTCTAWPFGSDQAATPLGAAAAALCMQLDGRGKMMRSPNGRCSRHDQSHSAARNPGRTRFPWGFVELLTRRLRCLWLTDSRHGGALEVGIPHQRWNRLVQDDPQVKTSLGRRIAACPSASSFGGPGVIYAGGSPCRTDHPVAVCAWSALPRSCVARRPLERVVGHLLPARLAPSEV
jgi:hypothetical protein